MPIVYQILGELASQVRFVSRLVIGKSICNEGAPKSRSLTPLFYFNGRLYPLKGDNSSTNDKKRSRANIPKNRSLSRIISCLNRQMEGRISLCASSVVVAIGLMVLAFCLIANPKKNISYKAEPNKQDSESIQSETKAAIEDLERRLSEIE